MGLILAHKKCELRMFLFFAQNGCLTIITLLRGLKIIIWGHVLCQGLHPFKDSETRLRDLGEASKKAFIWESCVVIFVALLASKTGF